MLQGGFFVEAGAWDCDSTSVSLPLEYEYGWTGIITTFTSYNRVTYETYGLIPQIGKY